MATATTTLSSSSSSSSLPLINGTHKFVSVTPFSFSSFLLHRRRIRHVKSRFASYRGGFQSRRRYDSENRFFGDYDYDVVPGEDDDEEEEEEERESSIDLLIRFLQSMFKKVSKRAKKASRWILPAAMSPRLVSFAVDGILLLGSLSITRAFLEVICNLGGTVFAVILMIRLFWVAASFFQSYGNSFGPNPLT